MKMVCITGITCTGKDTLVERMAQLYSDVGLIQVGKEFRRRYPPERFRGLAAMPDTEVESWQIFDEQLAAAKDKKIVMVTGQPRLPSQVNEIMKRCNGQPPAFYALTCTGVQLADRMIKRFDSQEEGWLTLAKQRVNNDKAQLYDVLLELSKWGITLKGVMNTTNCLDETCDFLYAMESK